MINAHSVLKKLYPVNPKKGFEARGTSELGACRERRFSGGDVSKTDSYTDLCVIPIYIVREKCSKKIRS